MEKIFGRSWVCSSYECKTHPDLKVIREGIIPLIKKLEKLSPIFRNVLE